jgi:hypothetical protein
VGNGTVAARHLARNGSCVRLIGWGIGKGKGRAGAGWWLGFLLGIIGVIIIACLSPTDEYRVRQAQRQWELQAEAAWRAGYPWPPQQPYAYAPPGQVPYPQQPYAPYPPPDQGQYPQQPYAPYPQQLQPGQWQQQPPPPGSRGAGVA